MVRLGSFRAPDGGELKSGVVMAHVTADGMTVRFEDESKHYSADETRTIIQELRKV